MSNSPFTPGYGMQPLVFGGHEGELIELRHAFQNYDFGDRKSILLSGLRGAGKTSMLAQLRTIASDAGWTVIADNASSGMLTRITDSLLPEAINKHQKTVQRDLVSLGFWKFQAGFAVRDTSRPVKRLLRQDIVDIAKATHNRGILFTIDEVAAGRTDKKEIREFANELSLAAEVCHVAVAFAGIKIDLDDMVKEEQTTFLRRSRDIDFRRLTPGETGHVLEQTARVGGRVLEPEAKKILISTSQGYPYLVQLVGDEAWRIAPDDNVITADHARTAGRKALKQVFSRVISRAYDDLSDRDRTFVRALATIGDRAKMAAVKSEWRKQLSADNESPSLITDQYAHQYKLRLIGSGYVESDGHGYVKFSFPYLGEYVRSMMAAERGEDTGDSYVEASGWDDFPAPPIR